MNNRIVVTLTILSALAAIAVPTALSIHIAHREGVEDERIRVVRLAYNILTRSEATADQADAAFKALVKLPSADPCAPERLAIMAKFDITSSYIQAIGHVSGNRLVCSSLQDRLGEIDLGPVDIVQPTGVRIRRNVVLPFAKGMPLLALERDGYVAIIHKQLPIDVSRLEGNVSLATLSIVDPNELTSHGFIAPEWKTALRQRVERSFVDRGYIVAVVPSKRYVIGALAALPLTDLAAHTRAAAMVVVPVGLAAGLRKL